MLFPPQNWVLRSLFSSTTVAALARTNGGVFNIIAQLLLLSFLLTATHELNAAAVVSLPPNILASFLQRPPAVKLGDYRHLNLPA